MVAVIHAGKTIRNAFHYNENKVKQGVAELIHSAGFTKDTEDLSRVLSRLISWLLFLFFTNIFGQMLLYGIQNFLEHIDGF